MKLKLVNGQELVLPDSREGAARYLADLFVNQGRLPDSDDRIEWSTFAETISPKNQDLTSVSEIRPLLQSATELLIREPVEPTMIVTNLFNRVQAKGLSTQVIAGAMGAIYADDVVEHGTYPEVSFQIGGAMQTAWIGKSGIAAAFTDEALRYSTWDMMAIIMRMMGAALVRHKENKAIQFLYALGTYLYDNMTPANSLYGVTTGRGLDLAANGTLEMGDLIQGIAHMTEQGFAPDVILMNPLYYLNWLSDPAMRAMALNFGGGGMWNLWQGDPGPKAPWGNGAMGGMGPSAGVAITPGGSPSGESATALTGRSNTSTSQPTIPSHFPLNLRIVVSPLVTYDPDTQLGDIYLLSSGNVGYYLVDEDPTTVEWRDEAVEVVKVKIRERYGFAVAHEGQGVGVYKNVKVGRNYWDGTVSVARTSISDIPADTAVV